MTTAAYIDKCRKLTATGSDYAVAKLIGVTQDAIHRYRKGERVMDNTTAILVARLLDLPPLLVIADCEVQRAKDDAHRELWEDLRTRIPKWKQLKRCKACPLSGRAPARKTVKPKRCP